MWKHLRLRLLDVAHREGEEDAYIYSGSMALLYLGPSSSEERKLLSLLPRRFDDFKEDSLQLKLDEDQEDEEMLLPLPEWAQWGNLEKTLETQDESTAEKIFGAFDETYVVS